MLSLRRPSPQQLEQFLAQQRTCELTYEPVGVTTAGMAEAPRGYALGCSRKLLAEGGDPQITEKAFAAAKLGLQRWQQFRLGWVEALPGDTALQEGEVVNIVAHTCGLWAANACRIIATIDEGTQPSRTGSLACFGVHRFGFVYGTLPDHVAAGEERFLIETDAEGNVWYDILAFSRPRGVLS